MEYCLETNMNLANIYNYNKEISYAKSIKRVLVRSRTE